MILKRVKISDIDFTENSRSAGKDLSELMASIKSEGLKQPVIICENFKTNKKRKPWILVAGNRRIGAVKGLGLKTIDAIFDDKLKNKADFLITNLTENMQREDISAYELGRYINQLIKEEKLCSSEKDVNDNLKKGYIIQKIIQTRTGKNGDNEITPTVIMVK